MTHGGCNSKDRRRKLSMSLWTGLEPHLQPWWLKKTIDSGYQFSEREVDSILWKNKTKQETTLELIELEFYTQLLRGE